MKYALTLLVCLNSPLFAATLEETVTQGLGNNPEVLVLAADRKIADNRLYQSFAGYLPKVDLNATLGRDQNNNDSTRVVTGGARTLTTRQMSYSLTQMLFDGFSVKHRVEENIARVKSAADNVVGAVEDLTLRITEVYLEVLRRQQLVEYAKTNLESHQEIYSQIKLRSTSGIGRLADLEQAQSRLALARTNLMTTQANYRDAEANFIRVVGARPSKLIFPVFQNELLPASEGVAVTQAIAYHPSLQAAQANVSASTAQKRAAKSSYYPTLEFELAGAHNKNTNGVQSNSSSLSAFLRMRYNIFNGGADRALERETAWQLEKEKETRNNIRRQVEQSTRLAWNTFTSSRAQLQYFKKHVDASQKTRDSYYQQFSIGQRTLLDLLNTENELYSARSSYISAQFNELLGKYRLLNSMGRLINYLHVRLPDAAIYNPTTWIDGFQL